MHRWLMVLSLALIATVAAADRLELNNGDIITGTIVRLDAETVVIETEYGLLEVDRDAVRQGQFGLTVDELSDSLVFRFDFDGTLRDSTGAHTPTNNGMRYASDRNGQPLSSLRSDGTGTYLSMAPSPELNELDDFTLAFWVQLEDLQTRQYLFSKWDRAEGDIAYGKVTIQTSDGDITVYLVDPGGAYHRVTARSVISAMTWHAVAVSFAGGRCAVYVDGEAATSTRFEFSELYTDTSPILVMTALARTDDPFTYYNALGSIDDLRLYSRALSPDEVALLAGGTGTE